MIPRSPVNPYAYGNAGAPHVAPMGRSLGNYTAGPGGSRSAGGSGGGDTGGPAPSYSENIGPMVDSLGGHGQQQHMPHAPNRGEEDGPGGGGEPAGEGAAVAEEAAGAGEAASGVEAAGLIGALL